MDFGASSVVQLPRFPRLHLQLWSCGSSRGIPLLECGDRLGLAITVLIGKADVAIGGVDAHQLVFDPLATFYREPQQLFDLLPGSPSMWEEELHQTRERFVDAIAIPRRDIGGKGEVLLVAVRVIVIAQRAKALGQIEIGRAHV